MRPGRLPPKINWRYRPKRKRIKRAGPYDEFTKMGRGVVPAEVLGGLLGGTGAISGIGYALNKMQGREGEMSAQPPWAGGMSKAPKGWPPKTKQTPQGNRNRRR